MAKGLKKAINKTNGQVVAEVVEIADNPITRMVGLMFRKGLQPGHGLWIVPCKDIHSMWMFFEFDAIFISKTGEVVHLMERMKPWRISKYVRKGHVVLELEAGTIERTQTKLGQTIELVDAG